MRFLLLWLMVALWALLAVCHGLDDRTASLYGEIPPAAYLLGQFAFEDHPELFSLQSQPPAANPSNTANRYLRNDVNAALAKMYAAFQTDYPLIEWSFVSGGRNYTYQQGIWNGKYQACGTNLSQSQSLTCALGILEYSSMPGTSRHHWGTDMDLCSLENEFFDSGNGLIIYEWWQKYASSFGFAQPYTLDRCAGYSLEKWHWSYVPDAIEFLQDWIATYGNHICSFISQASFDGSNQSAILAPVYVTTVGAGCTAAQLCGTNYLSSTASSSAMVHRRHN